MLVGNGTREASPNNHKTWISKVWLYLYSQYSSYISFGTDKENLSNNQSFLGWRLFPLFSWPLGMIWHYFYKEKLNAGHSWGWKD